MNLNNALRMKNPANFTKLASPEEVEAIVRQADELAASFQKVRELILLERYKEAGASLELLLSQCPDFLRTKVLGIIHVRPTELREGIVERNDEKEWDMTQI